MYQSLSSAILFNFYNYYSKKERVWYILTVLARPPVIPVISSNLDRVAMVMERSSNFGIICNYWKRRVMEKSMNFGILAKSHGKVMEFDKQILLFGYQKSVDALAMRQSFRPS